MQASQDFLSERDRQVVVNLITQLLREKPSDPVPFMYSYLKQVKKGIADPVCPTNKQIAEVKNLRKKCEFLRSQLDDDEDADHTPDSEEDASEDSEEEVKP